VCILTKPGFAKDIKIGSFPVVVKIVNEAIANSVKVQSYRPHWDGSFAGMITCQVKFSIDKYKDLPLVISSGHVFAPYLTSAMPEKADYQMLSLQDDDPVVMPQVLFACLLFNEGIGQKLGC